MTTRGQKRSNENTTSNVSESGTVAQMLTRNPTEALIELDQQDPSQTSQATAKDVVKENNIGQAIAKDTNVNGNETNLASAKDKG